MISYFICLIEYFITSNFYVLIEYNSKYKQPDKHIRLLKKIFRYK